MNGSSHSDPRYKPIYRLAGAAALLAALLTLGEVIALALYPQPATVEGWFELFRDNRLLGLLDFWLLEVPMYAMFVIVFLALYFVLREVNPGVMVLAVTFALVGSAVFFATNNPFAMLSLSDRYAVAATDAQRSTISAAGQALLANTSQRAIGGFNIGLFLVSVAGLLVSVVMLNCDAFGRSTAYVGIAANALSLADYLREALTRSAVIALLVVLPGVVLLVIWYVMVGRRLWHLGR